MTSTLLMFDDTDVSLLPAGFDAYAAYVDGRYANFAAVKQRFPDVNILSIDVNGSNTDANALDIEPGDDTNAGAVPWVRAKVARRDKRVVVYTSVSNVDALVATLTSAGISRSSYKIWSAHYGAGKHICGPGTCRLTSFACDGTQFTDRARGDSLDESLLDDGFFGDAKPLAAPKHLDQDFSRYPLLWSAVPGGNGSYRLKVTKTDGKVHSDRIVIGSSVVLDGLTKGVQYNIEVTPLGGPEGTKAGTAKLRIRA